MLFLPTVDRDTSTLVSFAGGPVRARWWSAANAKSALILFHSARTQSGCFAVLALECAARNLSVLAPDRRGHGVNKDLPGISSLESWTADVRAATAFAREQVGPEGKVLLGGWCWGGMLACIGAREGLADGVVLLAPSLYVRPAIAEAAGRIAQMESDALPFAFGAREVSDLPEVQNYLATDPRNWTSQPREFFVATRRLAEATRASMADVRCPTLVVMSKNDRVVDEAATVDKLGANPAISFDVMDRGGHGPFLEDPFDVSARIAGWLGKGHA